VNPAPKADKTTKRPRSFHAESAIGGATGPFLGGWLFDVTGSYRLAFMAACVAVAGSAVAAWFAARPMASAPDAQP
jgi:hypothetical protein